MAEQERLTKAERREQKRQRRLEEERAAAAAAARDRRRNLSYAVALVAIVGVLVYLALGNLTPTASIALSEDAAAEARAASGCEVVDQPEITTADVAQFGIEARAHLDPATAPSADSLYVNGRPTASGPHFTNPLPIVDGIRDEPVDERASTHNLEHGSVLVWFDEEALADEDVADIADWVTTLNESGFAENTGRAGILASQLGDLETDTGKPIAVRAWGEAMDCDEWDRDWANGFTIDHFGTHGTAPEAFIAEFPEDVLAYGDGGGDDGDSDAGEDATDEPGTTDEPDAGEDATDEPDAGGDATDETSTDDGATESDG